MVARVELRLDETAIGSPGRDDPLQSHGGKKIARRVDLAAPRSTRT
jgi:hypothetical protein